MRRFSNLSKIVPVGIMLVVSACAEDSAPTSFRAVTPVCVEQAPAEEAWTCDEVRTVSCEDANDQDLELQVELAAGSCAGADLQDVEGPFEPGEHTIEIEDDANGDVVCTATLEVVDDQAPHVETHDIELWPPNHKMHDIHIEDCIEVVECDPDWHAYIVRVSSDEPANANGDGNHEPDIIDLDDHSVSLRSERQGGSNGRVYTIDFEVEDGSGNVTADACHVLVPHDQGKGEAVDDGPAYSVDWQ